MTTTAPSGSPAGKTRSLPVQIATDGKFLRAGRERFLIKGVTYGTFAPDQEGCLFPSRERVAQDFAAMAALGVNTVRTYTVPPAAVLDEAGRSGLRVLAGIPWQQHVAFLDDRRLQRTIRRDITARVRDLADHPAVLMCAIGNEIPPGIVRWHGAARVEQFLKSVFLEAKAAAPDRLLTYANFPTTEFLDLDFFDVCSFNVYLHRERDLRAYLARLQHVAGDRPLLLAEAGADSLREGEQTQAALTAHHLRAAFEEGLCGAIAFSWTDEWWRGGHAVDDWAFGLVDKDRRPKPAAAAVARAFAEAPFAAESRSRWPRVSVVVCARNAADTLEDCLASLGQLDYPDYEVLVVNDGSTDATGEIARRHAHVRTIDVPQGGLSVARNIGLGEASGEIVAYTDADVRVDSAWLTYLVQPMLTSDVVGAGGPNVVPGDDPPMAQCVARAPGAPTHVLLDDRTAEHVPGCNMAFRRDALLAIGGFNPIFVRAGDDVDVCWRLQARGWRIGFAAAALVWHHHRTTVRAYWRQQVGYGEGETWLMAHHPEQFVHGSMRWEGRMYSRLPFVRSLSATRVNSGVWGSSPFPSVYATNVGWWAHLPQSFGWQLGALVAVMAALVFVTTGHSMAAGAFFIAGMGALTTTAVRNAVFAARTNLDGLGATGARRLWYRAAIFLLHLLQPAARALGRLQGRISPAEVIGPDVDAGAAVTAAWRDVATGLRFVARKPAEFRFWGEAFTPLDRLLTTLVTALRHSRLRLVLDDGWSTHRDVSVYLSRMGRIDLRALLEDHGSGRSLLRIGLRLRLTPVGICTLTGALVTTALLAWVDVRLGGPFAAGVAMAVGLRFRRLVRVAAAIRGSMGWMAASSGFVFLEKDARAHLRVADPPVLIDRPLV